MLPSTLNLPNMVSICSIMYAGEKEKEKDHVNLIEYGCTTSEQSYQKYLLDSVTTQLRLHLYKTRMLMSVFITSTFIRTTLKLLLKIRVKCFMNQSYDP